MPLTYRCHKGSPLTHQEMDDNFSSLDQRLQVVESTLNDEPPLIIRQENDILIVQTSNNQSGYRVQLPMFRPSMKGNWTVGTTYVSGDWMRHNGCLYSCMTSHIATTFDEQKMLWTVLLGECDE
jgi:hypothetical protein